jgi:hypothetical protein
MEELIVHLHLDGMVVIGSLQAVILVTQGSVVFNVALMEGHGLAIHQVDFVTVVVNLYLGMGLCGWRLEQMRQLQEVSR